MFALMDCDNFFVSCERVFAPQLNGKPVVVLSNNDGCVVSRSREAKAMGIKMGQPFFQVRQLADSGQLVAFSSNYTLYADLSRRVMSLARKRVPQMEQYSIDEAFLDFEGIPNPLELAQSLRAEVLQCVGIPVSIGIAPNKTLAKMASKFAKQYKGYGGCCLMDTEEKRLKALARFEIGDVWGIGRRCQEKMKYQGIKTAADFAAWNKSKVQRLFTVTGLHTWMELNGQRFFELDTQEKAKQQIISSRSFREPIADFDRLRPLVADFAATCARKLREQHSYAQSLYVSIRTDRFDTRIPQYAEVAEVKLIPPSNDPRELIAAAAKGLSQIFRPEFRYKKAAVSVGRLQEVVEMELFDQVDRTKQERLLRVIDNIQHKIGYDKLKVASQADVWKEMRHDRMSPCYTTDPNSIMRIEN